MKRLKEWWESQPFKIGLSFKWTLMTSVFVFVIVTIFSVVTYKTSFAILVKQERENIEMTLDHITKRLSTSQNELSIRNTTYYLREGNSQPSIEPIDQTLEANLIRLNTFISELSQPELSVSVYNLDKKLVFETRNTSYPYVGSNSKKIEEQKVGNLSGFVAYQPVFSQKTGEQTGYVQLFYDLSSVYEVRRKLLNTLVTLVLLGLVVSFVLGFILSTYFLRPLKQITEIINQIKNDPQVDVRIPEMNRHDEFGDLAEVFNDMMDRMQKFIEQQQQFVGDVSHELRTPVAIIEGHLKLLNRWGKDDPEILEESLEASLQEITRMKSLVQEMLDLSRIEQVEFQHKHDTSLAKEVIHQTVNNFTLLYEDFIFILDDDLSEEKEVKIYRNHFEQVLIILLDNAVKYSLDRKEIHVSVSSTMNTLEIAVQDYGEGIAEEDLDRVFNRFYRVDKARSRHKGGNGLGLAIAKELIENYRGAIQVDSVLGHGTVFRIQLPIK